jgi:hypothetical protein
MGILVALATLSMAGGLASGGGGPPAMLGFIDAATLSGICSPSSPKANEGLPVCLSYITGAADQLLAEQAMWAPGERTICLPRDVSAKAVMAAVNAYAGWSASAKGVSGANFVKFAMEQAYPCDAIEGENM